MSIPRTSESARRGPYAKTARVRAEIVEAATNVFATRGYHGGSLRDIARQIDIAPTSLIHHFGSKSGLLEAVLENADGSAAPWYPDHAEAFGLKAAILRLVEFNYSRPELLRLLAIMASEASDPDHPAHAWFVSRYEALSANMTVMIERDVAEGRVQAILPSPNVARIIIGFWDGLQLQWLLDSSVDMIGRMSDALDNLLPDS